MKTTRAFRRLAAPLLALILLSGCGVQSPDPYATAAEIDGIPVALGELQMLVDDVRGRVEAHFKSAYGAESVAGENWRRDFGGETPSGYAVGLALDRLREIKLVQNRLREFGKLEDISYQAFVIAWEAENKTRAKTKAAGGVLYGPVQYTKLVYYSYLFDGYKNDLASLAPGDPSEAELRALYDASPGLFTTMGTVTMPCLVLPQPDFSARDAQDAADRLGGALRGGDAFEAAAEDLGLAPYALRRVFTAEDFDTPDVREFPAVQEAIRFLPEGDFAAPIDNAGLEWLVLFCESRAGAGRRSFEDCRAELSLMCRERMFQTWLDESVSSAEVRLYEEIVALVQ